MPVSEPARVPAADEVSHRSPLGAIAVFLLSLWQSAGDGGLVVLAASERAAERLGSTLYALDPESDPMVLPRWDALPYDGGRPSREVTGRRASVLRRLCEPARKPLVLATADAALQRVPPRTVWADATLALRPGTAIAEDDLTAFFEGTGYEMDARVDAPGEVAIQGRMIDVFPAGTLGPVRIAYADGRVIGLQSYDPGTQRTTGELSAIVLDPASEMFAIEAGSGEAADPGSPALAAGQALETLFDYVPRARIVKDAGVDARAAAWLQQVREAHESGRALSALGRDGADAPPPERLFLGENEWRAALAGREVVELPAGEPGPELRVPRFAAERAPLAALRDFLEAQRAARRRVVLAAADEGDLRSLERRARRAMPAGIERAGRWRDVLRRDPGAISALQVDFERGFVLPGLGVAVIAAADVLGSRAVHDVPLGWRDQGLREGYEALRLGDLVVHLERGVGILRGLETVAGGGLAEQDVVRIEFAGATVMVPVEELALVWKYGAEGGVHPDRPGGNAWEKRRRELEDGIRTIAERLVALGREREAREAPKLVPPRAPYERFVARFPYFPTPDQARAAEEVLADLAAGRPMDRLVCGDVGFGKTEVALRAAAAAVFSGRQVAVAVPTTVLARQHIETFTRRFAGFGVDIAHLSRLVSPARIREVRKGLADGSIRLVIGTQAIAAKGVRFKELGLVVIDEEQRFGARQKAQLRALGEGVHVLTLTATPIPRTMQLAIAGLRELSVIATPPARRLPVRTIAAPFGPETVRTALGYEHRRGGQSFVVCPRIEDIEPWQERLGQIAPDLALRVVHGRMPADAIDEIMVRFVAGDGDVLLATNIIESGLDLPRANTILVWRPDRFGLAQLHQLRGRVGRGARRGYAYLLAEPDAPRSGASEKRLRALAELDRLGAGFRISERDLDLRGAGDLFGESQAGHVRLVGPALYRHLLDRALRESRGEPVAEEYVPEMNLEVTGRIPPGYVQDEETRLEIYARAARVRDEAGIEQLADEIEDRFGPVPDEVGRLLALARIREAARRRGIARIDAGPQAIAIAFRGSRGAAGRLRQGDAAWRWHDGRLIVARPSAPEARIEAVSGILDRLPG